MEGSKVVKAVCPKTGNHFSLEVIQVGGQWKVVDFVPISAELASSFPSEIRQDSFMTHDSLVDCRYDHSRGVGKSPNVEPRTQCTPKMKYQFACIYCNQLKIDYSEPTTRHRAGEKIVLPQGKVVEITFKNVEWEKFDNIGNHPAAPVTYMEPKVHVATTEKNIEFHGYNVSQMDEGVYYQIGAQDDFSIECDVDTSKISPHPGGNLYIKLGIITANIDQNGGYFYLDGESVGHVGSRFHMRLAVSGGNFSIEIDRGAPISKYAPTGGGIKATFGFTHTSHYCELLSHAYITDIHMNQRRMN